MTNTKKPVILKKSLMKISFKIENNKLLFPASEILLSQNQADINSFPE